MSRTVPSPFGRRRRWRMALAWRFFYNEIKEESTLMDLDGKNISDDVSQQARSDLLARDLELIDEC
jgi:hypothetical protein